MAQNSAIAEECNVWSVQRSGERGGRRNIGWEEEVIIYLGGKKPNVLNSVQLNQADLVQSSEGKNLVMISPYFYHVRIRISGSGSGPQEFGCVVEGLVIPLDIGNHALHIY